MKMKRLIKAIIWIFVIIFWIFYFSYLSFKSEVLVKEKTNIYVKNGWNFYSIWEKLKINQTYFKIYLKYNKPSFELKEW